VVEVEAGAAVPAPTTIVPPPRQHRHPQRYQAEAGNVAGHGAPTEAGRATLAVVAAVAAVTAVAMAVAVVVVAVVVVVLPWTD
jgi:hypothetical protein